MLDHHVEPDEEHYETDRRADAPSDDQRFRRAVHRLESVGAHQPRGEQRQHADAGEAGEAGSEADAEPHAARESWRSTRPGSARSSEGRTDGAGCGAPKGGESDVLAGERTTPEDETDPSRPLNRGEALIGLQGRRHREAHRRVADVHEHPAVHRAHRVGVLRRVRAEHEHRAPDVDLHRREPDQPRDGRRLGSRLEIPAQAPQPRNPGASAHYRTIQSRACSSRSLPQKSSPRAMKVGAPKIPSEAARSV